MAVDYKQRSEHLLVAVTRWRLKISIVTRRKPRDSGCPCYAKVREVHLGDSQGARLAVCDTTKTTKRLVIFAALVRYQEVRLASVKVAQKLPN